MISSAVREYLIISEVTRFSLGDARVVALDLDEVACGGGDAGRQSQNCCYVYAVIYMLVRYVLGWYYFLTDDNLADMPEAYRRYHQIRIAEIREDPKRIVFDEFHKARKWKAQVALLSQSLEDFDEIMVEFSTLVFIMDAGPEKAQAVRKSAGIFGLSSTAEIALKTLRCMGLEKEVLSFSPVYHEEWIKYPIVDVHFEAH